MKSLKPYLKGIVIFLAMAVFGAIFYLGGRDRTSRPPTKTTKLEALKATAPRKKSGLQ